MAIGSKRLVVGAHYGLRDWLLQRITAVVIASYTVMLLVVLLFNGNFGYDNWAGLFSNIAMKVFTLVAFFSLFFHAWIGMRDLWMDYVKSTGLRLTLMVMTVLWLMLCAVWSVQILWRV